MISKWPIKGKPAIEKMEVSLLKSDFNLEKGSEGNIQRKDWGYRGFLSPMDEIMPVMGKCLGCLRQRCDKVRMAHT